MPADLRVIDARSMNAAEAALTGESAAVGKALRSAWCGYPTR